MVQMASVGGGEGRAASKVGSLRSWYPCGLSKSRLGECSLSLAPNSVMLNIIIVLITGVELPTGMGVSTRVVEEGS